MLPFELDGWQHAVSDVLSLRVVEHLNVVEHVLAGLGPGSIGPAAYALAPEQIGEALGDGVVVAVPTAAHRVLQPVRSEEGGPVHAGELGALIRMDLHLVLWLPASHRHQQCVQDHVRRLAALHRPADDTA